jgi:CDP-diacylglycerol--glycerol-3-phosphate 3-phosphatidyltransferase
MREEYKNRGRKILEPLTTILVKSKLSPNIITILGLPLSIATGAFFALGKRWGALATLILVALTDTIDGELARKSNKVASRGAFLDSVVDRFTEIFIYSGFLFYTLINNSPVWYSVIIYFTITLSLMVSYIRARAEGIGKECKIGFMERPVRFLVLILGVVLLGYSYLPVAWGLIILGCLYTIIQRIRYVLR